MLAHRIERTSSALEVYLPFITTPSMVDISGADISGAYP